MRPIKGADVAFHVPVATVVRFCWKRSEIFYPLGPIQKQNFSPNVRTKILEQKFDQFGPKWNVEIQVWLQKSATT